MLRTIDAIIHGLPAKFIGIIHNEHGDTEAVYTTVEGSFLLTTTHVSNVRIDAPATPQAAVRDTGKLIRLIKLLREATAEAIREGNTSVADGKVYLSLTTAKRLAEAWLQENA